MRLVRARAAVLVALAAIVSACGVRPAITTRVTLEFPEPQIVRVGAVTEYELPMVHPERMAARFEAARQAVEQQRDEWSLRYASIEPIDERLIVDRRGRTINRVEHIATMRRSELRCARPG